MAMVATLRRAACPLALLAALAMATLIVPGSAQAQGRYHHFVTLRYGNQTAEGSGDTVIQDFEMDHGELVDDRAVHTMGIEYDLVTFPRPNAGVGLGLEYHQYVQVLHFEDPNGVKPNGRFYLKGRALLYTLKFYANWGPVWPYLGLGSGMYVANFAENNLVSYFEAAPQVYHGRLGARILMGEWSLLLEYGRTRAPLVVQRDRFPELELGGVYTLIGVGWEF